MVSLSMECFALLCDVLAFSCVLQYASECIKYLIYRRYASDGIGAPRIKLLGKLVRATSTLLFLGLLILLAKGQCNWFNSTSTGLSGWTITRGRLSSSSTRNLMFFMSLFAMVYAALYIIQIKVLNVSL